MYLLKDNNCKIIPNIDNMMKYMLIKHNISDEIVSMRPTM